MYIVKVIDKGIERILPPCERLEIKTVGPDSPAARDGLAEPGITLELIDVSREGKVSSRWVKLPQDGEAFFVMNDAGKTVDSKHWPPRGAAAVREATR